MMRNPAMIKSFLAVGLATAVSAFLAVSATGALADEAGLLNTEPVSSDELLAEKGEGLDEGLLTAGGDPLRRRIPGVGVAIEGGQNTITVSSGQTGQFNSSSLNAVNDLVSISNIAGGGG